MDRPNRPAWRSCCRTTKPRPSLKAPYARLPKAVRVA
jgi:hypothetical protein